MFITITEQNNPFLVSKPILIKLLKVPISSTIVIDQIKYVLGEAVQRSKNGKKAMGRFVLFDNRID